MTRENAGLAHRMNTVLDDPIHFRHWLMRWDALEVVGRSRCCHACPIARWLGVVFDRTILTSSRVAWPGEVYSGLYSEGCYTLPHRAAFIVPMPRWARDFIVGLDNDSRHAHEVTAQACLHRLGGKYIQRC